MPCGMVEAPTVRRSPASRAAVAVTSCND